ncbi:MAG: hypothetical protein ACHRHE_13890 [Tepidisphaerales bacterium]
MVLHRGGVAFREHGRAYLPMPPQIQRGTSGMVWYNAVMAGNKQNPRGDGEKPQILS